MMLHIVLRLNFGHHPLNTQNLDALGENFEKASKGFHFIALEAKVEDKNPLVGKEQACKYTKSQTYTRTS